MNVGMASVNQKKVCAQLQSVWIVQDTEDPRLNVHINRILAHMFSHGTLDSVVP